ncbi:MAG: alcohol dehydrogenase catalytic domain-containing protein [Spirochaetes bacterium]|nr:alcohol dehydrogenase catalytic domain-containing protein [Spirochaetota bacterium]
MKRTRGAAPVFELVDLPEPRLATETSVKIRVASIGICTSDVHVLHGAMQMPDDNIVGHEYSGEVVEVGSKVTAVKSKDRVVGELAVGACGRCRMCRSGKYELCRDKQPPGWVSPGVYTELVVMEEWLLHRIPDNVDFDVAAITEPMAICVYGCLERARLAPDDYTVVLGMGSIGLLTLVMLLDQGFKRVVCVTPTTHGARRFDLARELGAHSVLATSRDVEAVIAHETGGELADAVIDCSGSPDAINQGLRMLRKDGTMVGLGIASQKTIPIEYNTAVLKPLRIVFSCTSSRSSWDLSLRILSRQNDRIRRIITDRYPLAQWRTAYDRLEGREAIKAVLYNPAPEHSRPARDR